MRSIRITTRIIPLLALTLYGLSALPNVNAQSANATQIVFSATAATFDYATPPTNGDNAFGFWIWCSGPSGTTPYTGQCQGSMYFYGLSPATQPVQGTVSEVSGVYQMTVWSPNSVYSCQLTNGAPIVRGPKNTVSVLCTSPAGAATVTNAVVQISRN
jgi:hypothetical protein